MRKAKPPTPVFESSNIPSLWREGFDYAAKQQKTRIDEKKDDKTSAKKVRSIYANSITLTPGPVSVDMQGDEITVHALPPEAAAEAAAEGPSGEMDRRVTQLE